MEAGKVLYLAMKVQPVSAMRIKGAVLGMLRPEAPLSCDMPGLVGLVLVFDNEAQAAEWGEGHVQVVTTATKQEVST